MSELLLSVEEFDSAALGVPLRYRLCLPEGGQPDSSTTPLLLLLLHGSGGDEHSWDPGLSALQEAVAQGKLPPVAAVAPGTATSWWVDGREAVESAVISELLPHVAERFSLGHDGRIVAGFSMGGFGAVRYALRYPLMFTGALAMSSALYDGLPPVGSSARSSGAFGSPFDQRCWHELNYPALLEPYRGAGHEVPFFLAAGDGDWNEPAGWRFNTEYQTLLLFERLNKELGGPARLQIGPGGHDWAFWGPMFLAGLSYLLGDAGNSVKAS